MSAFIAAKGQEVTSQDRFDKSLFSVRRRMGAFQFVAEEISCVLTPHPGPLPVQGRGSHGGRASWCTGCGTFGHRSEQHPPNAGNEVRYSRLARRAPSPLKGERAGVRGEAVRLACPAPENEMRPLRMRRPIRTRPLNASSLCYGFAGAVAADAVRATGGLISG